MVFERFALATCLMGEEGDACVGCEVGCDMKRRCAMFQISFLIF